VGQSLDHSGQTAASFFMAIGSANSTRNPKSCASRWRGPWTQKLGTKRRIEHHGYPKKNSYARIADTRQSICRHREVARVAWEQAVQADQKLDEIKALIEVGDFDRAIDEMSEFVGAKKPAIVTISRKHATESQSAALAGDGRKRLRECGGLKGR